MKKIAMLLCAVLAHSAIAQTDVSFRFVDNIDKGVANEIATRFLNACPDLRRYLDDIEMITAEYHVATDCLHDDACNKFGWERQFTIAVKLSDNTSVVPEAFRAWGHTLHYTIGGGEIPDIRITKPQSALVCNASNQLFVNNNLFKIVDSVTISKPSQ